MSIVQPQFEAINFEPITVPPGKTLSVVHVVDRLRKISRLLIGFTPDISKPTEEIRVRIGGKDLAIECTGFMAAGGGGQSFIQSAETQRSLWAEWSIERQSLSPSMHIEVFSKNTLIFPVSFWAFVDDQLPHAPPRRKKK